MRAPSCARCDRRYRAGGAWHVTLCRGVVIEVVCPACQTPAKDLDEWFADVEHITR